jgi:NADPH-dependent glutamate synthase beta subunit-like oxidoreductase/Pyruvate/2-oxoacid:ferredoxin oxidoreductase delta subunit
MPLNPDIFSDAALRHVRQGSTVPPGKLSASELPPMAASWASTEKLPVGAWKEFRPVYERGLSPCLTHCPVGNDVEGFISLVREGKIEEATRLLVAENPFPSICGRVCYHPCESGCNRKDLDNSVGIRAIERFLGDQDSLFDPEVWTPAHESTGKRVAVVGAGPGGMSCAWALILLGHSVDVYEKQEQSGGLLRYGIPAYRLPKDVLDREISRLERLGVNFICGSDKGQVSELKELLGAYDAVFTASGATGSRDLGLQDIPVDRQRSAIDFLRSIAMSEQVNVDAHCLVIGGGNSAIDAARSARRFGGEVTVVYRRDREDMPAFEAEVQDALDEGVKLIEWAIPHEVRIEQGRLKALTCLKARPGEPDASGRSRPVPVPGSHFDIPAGLIINAIGEEIQTSEITQDSELQTALNEIQGWGESARRGLFAGGDFAGVERTVAHAIGGGKRAAMAIDRYLSGVSGSSLDAFRVGGGPASLSGYLRDGNLDVLANTIKVVEYSDLNPDYFPQMERRELEKIVSSMPTADFSEMEDGLTLEQLAAEAARCFSCGRCTNCGLCQIFCPEGAVHLDRKSGEYKVLDSHCKGCGICVEECPRCAIRMEPVNERRG